MKGRRIPLIQVCLCVSDVNAEVIGEYRSRCMSAGPG
jgi:hypothetical protein